MIWISGEKIEEKIGILEKIRPYMYIRIDGILIPFVGWTMAIQKIFSIEGEILYSNEVPKPYQFEEEEKIYEILRETFGKEIGEKVWQEKNEFENLSP